MKLINSNVPPDVMGLTVYSTMIAEHHPYLGQGDCPNCQRHIFLYSINMIAFVDQQAWLNDFSSRKRVRVECEACKKVLTMKKL